MTPRKKKPSAGSSDHLVDSNTDPNAASQNAQDQALLKALQALIVPLIRQTVGQQNIDQISLGPEAGKLITALKEFISSVVRSQPEEKTTIKVGLSKEDIRQHVVSKKKETRTRHDDYGYEHLRTIFSQDEVFKELHEHVFNKMPIRLLCFEHLGSGLHISLVERNSIYTRIETTIREQMHEAELLPISPEERECDIMRRLFSKYAGYAILSHTWLRTTSGEVTYGDWTKGQLDANDTGYQKLANFCKTAWRDHGVAFGWMDTVCINKDSSSELDQSIRSMYKWYQRASVCITHLAETETLSTMHLDPWFTRGWTLQELLAPQVVMFYNCDWNRFVKDAKNDKTDAQIYAKIELATSLSRFELEYIRGAPISRRMELAAKRKVTREEDTAYSLMGIFAVNLATAYGEGASSAFTRLMKEILATTAKGVMDIFNWGSADFRLVTSSPDSEILPVGPQDYLHRSIDASDAVRQLAPTKPLTLTHLGIHVSLILMPAILTKKPADPFGDFDAIVSSLLSSLDGHVNLNGTYHLLDKNISASDGRFDGWTQSSFAVLNFTEDRSSTDLIYLPKTCFALALQRTQEQGPKTANLTNVNVINTMTPIVFHLNNRNPKNEIFDSYFGDKFYKLKIEDLARHGMELVSMYL